jgi:hypothetical protein
MPRTVKAAYAFGGGEAKNTGAKAMDILKRFDDVENFIKVSERNLVEDAGGDFDMLDDEKEKIYSKYRHLELEVTARYERDKAAIDALCDQASTLVDGIRRRLFTRQRRQLRTAVTENDPEQALARLRTEIGSFETTILPLGLRQLVDSITLLFNSNYGQTEVDRIVGLYNSVLQVKDSDALEKSRDAEILRLKEECAKRIRSLENATVSSLDGKVDVYISELEKKIFT